MKLSVIIPVYNEERTLEEIINRVNNTGIVHELICVNDASADNSSSILKKMSEKITKLKIVEHKVNKGKGAAIISGLKEVTGDIVLIQDADLEYDPSQYKKLVAKFEDPGVMVVYGSRNINKNPKSSSAFYYGGVFLSKLTNILYGSSITDESTCYKLFRTDLLRQLDLKENGFEFCPEVTAKVLKRKIKIHEVPITYSPRSHSEGKKIKWHDGLKAISTLFKYRFKS